MTEAPGGEGRKCWTSARNVRKIDCIFPGASKSMRVVHILTRFGAAGSEENTLLTCKAQVEAGNEVIVIFGGEADPQMELALREVAEAVQIKDLVWNISIVQDFKATRRMVNVLTGLKPDVVHTHQSKAGVVGRLAAKLAGVPVIIHGVHILPFVGERRRQADHVHPGGAPAELGDRRLHQRELRRARRGDRASDRFRAKALRRAFGNADRAVPRRLPAFGLARDRRRRRARRPAAGDPDAGGARSQEAALPVPEGLPEGRQPGSGHPRDPCRTGAGAAAPAPACPGRGHGRQCAVRRLPFPSRSG